MRLKFEREDMRFLETNMRRLRKGLPPIERGERTIEFDGAPRRYDQREGGKFVE